MKKIALICGLFIVVAFIAFNFSSCSTQREIVENKSGAELWGQNCVRCHNIPSPSAYNDDDWETIGLHMKERANMTTDQIDKIVKFLQTAN